jgi:hypothetical protein
VARPPGSKEYLGAVLLISAAASLSHVAALLRRFGFEVHELCGLPTPAQVADREGCEVQLVIVDETLCIGAEADPVALLLGMLSLASILIVQRAASRLTSPRTASDRCRYLAASSSPFDLTLTVVELLKGRGRRAH